MPLAARLRRLAPHLAPAALVAACAAAPSPEATPGARVDSGLRPFLPPPASVSGDAGPTAADALHRRLLAGEDPLALIREAEALAAGGGAGPELRLLIAEAALAAGAPERARAECAELGPLPAAGLVAGRAAELLGDPVAAVESYRAAEKLFPAAAGRRAALEPEAVAELHRRIAEELGRHRIEAARADLRTLAGWRPREPATWRLAARVARAGGDRPAELDALRSLSALQGEPLEDRLRRGALEVEVGDAAAGLVQLEALAASHPGDPEVRRAWVAARHQFRLANAPEPVRRAGAAASLSRADFALLLYWLVPEVRSARGGTPRIATDILDHPAREEIVRVANLGLLRVDEDLHLFEPERPLRRIEAFRALLPILDGTLGPEGARAADGDACARAAGAGWIPEAGECLPAAPVSGAEALGWIRRAVEPAGGGGQP